MHSSTNNHTIAAASTTTNTGISHPIFTQDQLQKKKGAHLFPQTIISNHGYGDGGELSDALAVTATVSLNNLASTSAVPGYMMGLRRDQ